MNLSEYQIRKLVDISVAEMEGVAYKIMSKPKYKEKLFNTIKIALNMLPISQKDNLVDYLTNARRNDTEWWDCLPITKYTKLSNRELFSLLNKC